MLHLADSSLPASSPLDDDFSNFLGEAIALAQRINRQLDRRASSTTGEPATTPTTPVEN